MILKILIADDHKLFRQGLISLMKTRGDFVRVVGEASTGTEAIRLAERLRPDIILMDIYMPEKNGLEATREIREKYPEIAIVILTSSEADEHLNEAVSLGISGYLLKNLDGEELFDLLMGIAKGEAAMTRAMAARLLKNAANVRVGGAEADNLTGRELEVLRAVAHGASNHQIADELVISINTVKTHLKNISAKLQLDNRTQVAAYALEKGLVRSYERGLDR
ncbi:MAG: response regulator transcription factor [Chloroflexi bacterium]|jgi:DNA-binding NarL/FixJ family response regulator|nr:response regulator transcription factor [Chloroflexota bacterium]MBT7601607.1 response regulator transcription factor [Anaerolineae bacterium]MBT7988800.1 response regulator transcription factor [Anaerolineae bacterium]